MEYPGMHDALRSFLLEDSLDLLNRLNAIHSA